MNKIKLTNTWKHAAVALAFSLLLLAVDWAVHALDPKAIFEIGWFVLIAFSMGAIAWESAQKNPNWKDTAADLIAGIGTLAATLWLGGLL